MYACVYTERERERLAFQRRTYREENKKSEMKM